MQIRCFLAAVLVWSLVGCTPGIIYSDTTVPLVKNMRDTPASLNGVDGDSYYVRIPLINAPLSAEWSSRAIGDAAKRAGLREINYADMRTISVLLGVWKSQTVMVRGKE